MNTCIFKDFKELIAKQFVQPMVVIGDGDNDSGIAGIADIGITGSDILDEKENLNVNNLVDLPY